MMESGKRPIEQGAGTYTEGIFVPLVDGEMRQGEITAPGTCEEIPQSDQPTELLPFAHKAFKDLSYRRPSFYDRETARGTEMVSMDARASVACGAEEEKRIATFGLKGCTAAALVLESTDGQRRGYIQHYSFRNEDTGVRALNDELKTHVGNLRAARLIIMTPGRIGISGKFPLEPTNGALANALALTGITYLGEDNDIQIYAYEETQKWGATDQGTLMVELLAGGAVNIVADGRLIRPLPASDPVK